MESWEPPTSITKERVCGLCHKKILDFQNLERTYRILAHLPLDVHDIHGLRLVSRNWNRVVRYYLATLRRVVRRNITDHF